MKALSLQPSLVEQAYAAIVDAICDGTIAANTHLIQEQLAERLGVSRQPIQQALLLLRNDGIVEDGGRRGLVVAPLDHAMMRDRYQVRAALDELAVRLAAARAAASPAAAAEIRQQGEAIIAAGIRAAESGSLPGIIAEDVGFHNFMYVASGNGVLWPTAQPHWRYLRRVMAEVYRRGVPGAEIWQQHRAILDAVLAGDPEAAARLSNAHVARAGKTLSAAFVPEG